MPSATDHLQRCSLCRCRRLDRLLARTPRQLRGRVSYGRGEVGSENVMLDVITETGDLPHRQMVAVSLIKREVHCINHGLPSCWEQDLHGNGDQGVNTSEIC